MATGLVRARKAFMVRRLLAAGCALAVLVALAARAEQPAAEEGEFRARTVQEWAARYDAQAVAATVNGEAIRLGEVHRQMRSAFGERPLLPAVWDDLQARTLNQMIDRRLILAYLAERPGAGASEADINLAVERIEAELARQKVTLEEHLKALGLSREDMLHGLRWQIGWQRYLDRFLTAENLKRYFEQHRREKWPWLGVGRRRSGSVKRGAPAAGAISVFWPAMAKCPSRFAPPHSSLKRAKRVGRW